MSDETTDQVETTETVETNTPLGPDGQPWDFERQQRTIENLRAFEPDAKAYKRLSTGEDPDAFAKLAEAYGYELTADEPEPDDDEWEDPRAAELAALKKEQSEIKQYVEQRKIADAIEAFQSDLTSMASAKEVELEDWEKEFILARAINSPKGLTADSTKEAFEALHGGLTAREQKFIEKHGIKPKAARKPIQGESASQVPDLKSSEDKADYIQRMMQDMAD